MNHQAEYLEEELRKARAEIEVLETELAQKSLLVREMDLMFGRMLLGMRAAVIEEEHGKGAEAAMVWIFNGLVGPGELPPEEETDAQAYFDREVEAIDEGMKKIMGERKSLAAAPAPVERVEQEAKVFWVLFDNTGDVKYIKKDVYSGTLAFFDNEADASRAKRFNPGTDYKRVEYYATPQPAPTAAQDVAGLVEVPGWLLEMAEQMRGQPTRSTAHPFWQVRCKRHIPTAEGYNDSHYEVVGDEGVVWRSIDPIKGLIDHLLENHEEWCRRWAEDHDHMKDCSTVAEAIESFFDASEGELPDGLTSVFVQEVEEVVTTHLTQADAEWFIKRKQHDYPPLYTYVESAYWSPQMRQLQDWIISLAHQQREGE